jgi:DNA-binding PadR family transcriptional regulator
MIEAMDLETMGLEEDGGKVGSPQYDPRAMVKLWTVLGCGSTRPSARERLFILVFLKHIRIYFRSIICFKIQRSERSNRMDILTRAEELILVAVWRLQENAYCVPIRAHLAEVTGKKWSFGSIYDGLDRLEKKGHLESTYSEPCGSRGGRSKRIYRQTRFGYDAMLQMMEINEKLWAGIAREAVD